MKKKLLTGLTTSMLMMVSVGIAQANIIDDTYGAGAGGFELGNFVSGGGLTDAWGQDYMGLAPGDTTITGWTVGGPGNGVDWLSTPNFAADSGIHSVDLTHLSASSIFTVIPTIAGNLYSLSFSAATSNAPPIYPNYTGTGVVSAGSLVNQAFVATLSVPTSAQTYTPYSFLFTATEATTTIKFTSTGLSNSYYGPVIDSVSVSAVPEPTTILLFSAGLAWLADARRRSKKQ
ncbi:MAG: DUF642 domain-containing protein [Methylophilaceae bacterium]|nr:DUF642 domain-containing protein [Methylophilaceae bacterium]